MKLYYQLFITFFRIGAFTIGGGYAMIPLIEKEVVDSKKWIERKEFLDMLAMAQSAPGVLAINTAIFIGYKIRGFKGCLVTTFGCALPSFLIILLIATFFLDIKDNTVIASIFKGIRPAVVALIAVPVWRMAKTANITWKTAIIPIGTALLIWGAGVSPVIIIAAAIAGGILWGSFRNRA